MAYLDPMYTALRLATVIRRGLARLARHNWRVGELLTAAGFNQSRP